MTTDGIKKVSSYSAERLMESKQTLLLVALIKISLWKGSAAFSPASELDFTLPFLYVAELSHVLPNICSGTLGKILLEICTHKCYLTGENTYIPVFLRKESMLLEVPWQYLQPALQTRDALAQAVPQLHALSVTHS